MDCDTFYTVDIKNIFKNANNNIVFFVKNTDSNHIFSYIELDEKNKITNIKEKIKISDNSNTGAYAFMNIKDLYLNCDYVLKNNITFNGEPYTSCVLDVMVNNGNNIYGIELNTSEVFNLGTPEQLKNYAENTCAFLFDLDGTIILTDEIYYNVWDEILKKYNIKITEEIFKKYIQGNNDNYVKNTLLKNIVISVKEMSKLKDELFIKNIKKIKIIDGIMDILNCIKKQGHKCCIVTNCNKNVALKIIEYLKIDIYFDFIISSCDCINGKPHSEPYLKAIKNYNISSKKCIIFEDSKTGLLSAKGVDPKLLIGIETLYDHCEILNYGVDFSIKNYTTINIEDLIFYDNLKQHKLISQLKNCFDEAAIINIKETKLKGGFIADVIPFNVLIHDKSYEYILKYENINPNNNLSKMALQLQLYDREYYFYEKISKYVNVKIPNFIHFLKDDNFITRGIILENLFFKKYKLNLNLNNEKIEISLNVIDNMAKLHSKFWNKNLKQMFNEVYKNNDIIFNPFMKKFIEEKKNRFKEKWLLNANEKIKKNIEHYIEYFENTQSYLSENENLTFIHGDIKSPNIFYDEKNNYEPYFIDWQHCAIGKGVQDLIFFIIESFDIENLKLYYDIFKNFYYIKLLSYGVKNYSYETYENDIKYALFYIPLFTSIWFGTLNDDELIDKNFPYFFINKLFYFIECIM